MKIVIDRLTDDSYGERFKGRCIGREIFIDEDFGTCTYLGMNDLDHPYYGYCSGYYMNDRGEGKFCYSFTCVCLDDEGYPL